MARGACGGIPRRVSRIRYYGEVRRPTRRNPLTKLLLFIAATIGGAIGWWIGALVGFMTAFFMSIVGTAVGVYVARTWAAGYVD